MTVDTILVIGLLAGLLWFWLTEMRARERAIAASQWACRQVDAQWLDQSVALTRIGWLRADGSICIKRQYSFEFSQDRLTRRHGRVILVGERIASVQVDDVSGATLILHRG